MKIPLFHELTAQLQAAIYMRAFAIPEWNLDAAWNRETPPPHRRHTRYIVTSPFGGYDQTVWFLKKLETRSLPTHPALLLDLPESLVFINGNPYQGVDANHQEVTLHPAFLRKPVVSIAIQAYAGRKDEKGVFRSAYVVSVNRTARALYNGLTALHDAMSTAVPHDAQALRAMIEELLSYFEGVPPDSLQFNEAIKRAYARLNSMPRSRASRTVHLIPHSHIDAVWLWRWHETRRKCGRTFSTMLRLMEEVSDFTFTQSQAVLYDAIKQQYPDLYRQIRQRIAEGRWLPVGSMWVEPDCNIPNGEALVRQILYGKKFFAKEFDTDSDILWLPDTFGYSWALPQILKKSGINYFFTTKLTWNDTTKFPHNSFWWEGIDGTRVLAHIPPVGLEGMAEASHITKSWRANRERRIAPAVLQTFGFGDGGGGPTIKHVEAAQALRVLPEVRTQPSTPAAFFKELARHSRSLPVWRDELYLELHRGTFTTHGEVKRANREAERDLYNAELLCSMASVLAGEAYPAKELEQGWKQLLFNQFHDIVPGTSIADAYRDATMDFARLRETCTRLTRKAVAAFVSPDSGIKNRWHFTLFNPLHWSRSEYVPVTLETTARAFAVIDDHGRLVEHQIIAAQGNVVELLCFVEDIPALAFAGLAVHALRGKPPRPPRATFVKRRLKSRYYDITFSSRGTLLSLYDKELKRELLAGEANVLQTFHDKPKLWEAWEIDNTYRPRHVFRCTSAKIITAGHLRATIRFTHASAGRRVIVQDVHVYHKSKRIDFVTHVDWHKERTLMKVAFPLNVKADAATVETQFGAIRRPTHPTTQEDKAKFEVPMQQWIDLSDARGGVSILNDSKYGCDINGNTLRLTLLRSPRYPHPIEPWWLQDVEATDQGEHRFTYSLHPHGGDWRKGETTKRARELNSPVLMFRGTLTSSPAPLLTLNGKGIFIDSIKKAEEGTALVIRLHEGHGTKGTATLVFRQTPQSIQETDLLENPIRRLKVQKVVTLSMKKFEIKTLKVLF